MPTRFNRLLIPFVFLILISLGNQRQVSGKAPGNYNFLPMVSYSPSKWIGPSGGTITSIAVDPGNAQVIYAGSFGSGVFKSINGGQIWNSSSLGLTNLNIYSLTIDPTHTSTLYAGTYDSQVFKSIDGGNTWTWSGNGMQDSAIVYSLAVDPFTPNILFASTRGISNNNTPPWRGIIYKSIDAGQNWNPSLTDVGGTQQQDWAYSLAINPNNHIQVFAALHEWGPYRTDTADSVWVPIHSGLNDWSARSIVVSPQPEYSSRLYLGVWKEDSVYKSTNSGNLWTGANHDLIQVAVSCLALDPFSVNTVYLASFTDGVLKTTDAGASWIPSGLIIDKYYSIVINPNMTNNLFAGTAGDGLYRSMNSSMSWEKSDTGINNAMVTAVIHHPSDPMRMYSSVYGAGVYLSKNQGQSWEEMNVGLEDKFVHDLVMDPLNSNVLYALTDTGGLYKNDLTTGQGWVSAGQGLPVTGVPLAAYSSDDPSATLEMKENFAAPQNGESIGQLSKVGLLKMVFAPSDPGIVYIGTVGKGVYRSTDAAISWEQVGLSGSNVRGLAVDPIDSDLVYAATNYSGSMKYSTDGGISWYDANLPVYFYSVATSPFESGIVYAGTNSGIYRYQSGTWSALGLSDQTVTAIAADPIHHGVLYAGTSNGAYSSNDNGVTWNFVDNLLSGQTILSINFDPTNPRLIYFSTKTHGVYLLAIQ
jgi:photosystem II stability/assembly factor-like uncharacterized protein